MLGQMVNVSTCPRCRGDGRIVETPCEKCKGDGRIETRRKLRVTIPAGIDEGHQIRLSNEGEVGPRGGPAGSLYVAVHVAEHPNLRREGTELVFEADISIAQAALGTTLRIPAIDGDEEVEVKPGTQPGTEIRLRGKGVPHLRRTGSRGDLHVFVNVAVPTKLNRRQRELLQELAAESDELVSVNGSGGSILDRVKDALG
jgi:molecular chaperone DnaJ